MPEYYSYARSYSPNTRLCPVLLSTHTHSHPFMMEVVGRDDDTSNDNSKKRARIDRHHDVQKNKTTVSENDEVTCIASSPPHTGNHENNKKKRRRLKPLHAAPLLLLRRGRMLLHPTTTNNNRKSDVGEQADHEDKGGSIITAEEELSSSAAGETTTSGGKELEVADTAGGGGQIVIKVSSGAAARAKKQKELLVLRESGGVGWVGEQRGGDNNAADESNKKEVGAPQVEDNGRGSVGGRKRQEGGEGGGTSTSSSNDNDHHHNSPQQQCPTASTTGGTKTNGTVKTTKTKKRAGGSLSSSSPSSSSSPLLLRVDDAFRDIIETTNYAKGFKNFFPYEEFNKIQSSLFEAVYNSNKNIVLAAPTGSGKTAIFEFAILRQFKEGAGVQVAKSHIGITNDSTSSSSSTIMVDGKQGAVVEQRREQPEGGSLLCSSDGDRWKGKAVYLGPIKALLEERRKDWGTRFHRLGIRCNEIVGDVPFDESLSVVSASDIILTTPEKWDAVTRRWKESREVFESVSLMLIDEAHTIGDETRGVALEVVISRMKLISRLAAENNKTRSRYVPAGEMRIIALSATMPNVQDVATFIKCDKANVHSFGPDFRPVPLSIHVMGFNSSRSHRSNQFLFERYLDTKVFQVVEEYADKRPTLVFCASRQGAKSVAASLQKQQGDAGEGGGFFVRGKQHQQRLIQAAARCSDAELGGVIRSGVAFHNAALDDNDRHLVETLFIAGDLGVLASTSTLALGVNLPAHLVIIKSTKSWRGAAEGYQEYKRSAVMQMIGRAGRPGFDTSGVAVVMTHAQTSNLYAGLAEHQELVESRLLDSLPEVLNAEVACEVISNMDDAIKWLQESFLYTRTFSNPKHYSLVICGYNKSADDEAIEKQLKDRLASVLVGLERAGMISVDLEESNYESMAPGLIMSGSYISLDSMQLVTSSTHQTTPWLTMEEMVSLVSSAKEMQRPLRRAEKSSLNAVNAKSRYRQKGRVMTTEAKVFQLFQAAFGGNQNLLNDWSLKHDLLFIFRESPRIVGAYMSYFGSVKQGLALRLASTMKRNIECMMWENYPGVLRQLKGLGESTCQKLAASGITTFEHVAMSEASVLSTAAQRALTFGTKIKGQVARNVPFLAMDVVALPVVGEQEETNNVVDQEVITPTRSALLETTQQFQVEIIVRRRPSSAAVNGSIEDSEEEDDDSLLPSSDSSPSRKEGQQQQRCHVIVYDTASGFLLFEERFSVLAVTLPVKFKAPIPERLSTPDTEFNVVLIGPYVGCDLESTLCLKEALLDHRRGGTSTRGGRSTATAVAAAIEVLSSRRGGGSSSGGGRISYQQGHNRQGNCQSRREEEAHQPRRSATTTSPTAGRRGASHPACRVSPYPPAAPPSTAAPGGKAGSDVSQEQQSSRNQRHRSSSTSFGNDSRVAAVEPVSTNHYYHHTKGGNHQEHQKQQRKNARGGSDRQPQTWRGAARRGAAATAGRASIATCRENSNQNPVGSAEGAPRPSPSLSSTPNGRRRPPATTGGSWRVVTPTERGSIRRSNKRGGASTSSEEGGNTTRRHPTIRLSTGLVGSSLSLLKAKSSELESATLSTAAGTRLVQGGMKRATASATPTVTSGTIIRRGGGGAGGRAGGGGALVLEEDEERGGPPHNGYATIEQQHEREGGGAPFSRFRFNSNNSHHNTIQRASNNSNSSGENNQHYYHDDDGDVADKEEKRTIPSISGPGPVRTYPVPPPPPPPPRTRGHHPTLPLPRQPQLRNDRKDDAGAGISRRVQGVVCDPAENSQPPPQRRHSYVDSSADNTRSGFLMNMPPRPPVRCGGVGSSSNTAVTSMPSYYRTMPSPPSPPRQQQEHRYPSAASNAAMRAGGGGGGTGPPPSFDSAFMFD